MTLALARSLRRARASIRPDATAASAWGRLQRSDGIPFARRLAISPDAPEIPPLSASLYEPPLPIEQARKVALVKGANITSLPHFDPLPDALTLPVLLKMRDDVSTDEILPAGAKALPYRSNLQKIANFSFERIDPSYVDNARAIGQTPGHAVIAGKNYGQGSSREHAAAAPRYLDLRMVIAKSFARIHRQNLINYGVLPLVFINSGDYDRLAVGDTLWVGDLRKTLASSDRIVLRSANATIEACHGLTSSQIKVILAGGVVNFRRGNMNEERGGTVLAPII